MVTTATKEGRTCTTCKQFKPHAEMTKAVNRPYGTGTTCRACKSIWYRAKYYEEHKDRILAHTTNYHQKNKDAMREASYVYRKKDPLKNKARAAVGNAVRAGKFIKLNCRECGESKVDFHHTNGYEEKSWFVGMWLCRVHHAALHRNQRLSGGKE